MAAVLTVSSISGDVHAEVHISTGDSLGELRRRATVAIRERLQGGSGGVVRLLSGGSELAGQGTLEESGLADGSALQFVVVPPEVRLLPDSSESWNNTPGSEGPALEEGEIAIVATSVGSEQGTASGVTRQCVKSSKPYTIHFCKAAQDGGRSDPAADALRSIAVEGHNIAVVHRKTGDRTHGRPGAVIDAQVWWAASSADGGCHSTFILFEGGFPRGGECFADVHAPWGNCYSCIPAGGSVIIEVPWDGDDSSAV